MTSIGIFRRRYLSNFLAIVLAVSGLQAIAISSAPTASALTWTDVTGPTGRAKDWQHIRTNNDGSVIGVVSQGAIQGNLGDLYLSRDSGASWTYTSQPTSNYYGLYRLAISGNGNIAIAADDSYIVKATYSGSAWSYSTRAWSNPSGSGTNQRCAGYGPNFNSFAASTDGSNWVAGARDEGCVYSSSDSGANWSNANIGGTNFGSAISADGTIRVTSNTNGNIYRNSGSGWSAISTSGLPASTGWSHIACDSTCTKMAIATYGGKIYTTSNSGANWSAGGSANRNTVDLSMSLDGSVIAIADGAEIYISKDLGATWSGEGQTGKTWTGVTVSGDGTKIYAAASDGTIRKANIPPTISVACSGGGSFSIENNVVTTSTLDCAGAVVIPDGVTSIASNAFYRVGKTAEEQLRITSVTIANSVTSVGAHAFNANKGITSLTLGTGLTTIGAYGFRDLYALTNLVIPPSVRTIGTWAFADVKLTSLTLNEGLETIGGSAFLGHKLVTLVIPNSVTTISTEAAFAGWGLIETLTLGSGLTTIGNRTFEGVSRLQSLTIPPGVTTLGTNAFRDYPQSTYTYCGTSLTQTMLDSAGLTGKTKTCPVAQTITRTSTSPTSPFKSGTYTPTATASSGLTVAITIASGSSSVCSIASGVVTFNTVGSCVIQYNQSGNSSYFASAEVTETLTIGKATPTFSAWSDVSKNFEDSAFTVTAPTVTGSLPGTFSYSSATTSVISVSGTTLTVVGAGSSVITATFTPTDTTNYNSATTFMTVTVGKANQATLSVANQNFWAHQNQFPSLWIPTGGSGTGALEYSVISGPCTISSGTLYGNPTGPTGPRVCTLTVTKLADTNYNAITSASFTATMAFSFNRVGLALPSAATTATYGTPVVITATSFGQIPGTISFRAAGQEISGCTNKSVTAPPWTTTCTWTPSASGATNLTYDWVPSEPNLYDTKTNWIPYKLSTDSLGSTTPVTITVAKIATTNLLALSSATSTYGSVNTITATVSFPGTVAFKSNGTDIAGCESVATTLASQYTAACAWIPTGVGSHSLTAVLTPSDAAAYATSTATLDVTVVQGEQTNALAITSTTVIYGSSLSLITSGGDGAGSNSFVVDSGPCTVLGSTLTPTAVGTCMVTATKAANGNYLAASSVSTAITVSPKGLTISGLTGVNKEFDRSPSGTVTGTPTLIGVVGSDNVLLGGTPTFTFASANVANGITVTASGYTLTGTTASNYTLTQPTVTANITAKAVRVAATNTTVAFGAPVISGVTASGLITPDAVGSASYTYTGTGTSTPPTAVGVYTVTPSNAVLSTGTIGNYTISYDTATLTILAKYTVTFNANGGTVLSGATSNVDFVVGDNALTLPTPTRANYTFTGWHTLQTNGIQVTGAYTPTASATLWAHWVQNSLYGMGASTKILTITTLAGVGNTYSANAAGGTIGIEYLADALPAGTIIDAYVLSDTSTATTLIGASNNYVMSLVLAWVALDGTVPTTATGKAISMTITNSAIKKGAKVYSVIGENITLVGTATIDGSAVISITDDPQIIIAITKPDAPTGVFATSGGNTVSTVTWIAPANDGGSAITSYTAISNAGQSCTTSRTSCQINGLTNGTSYTFTVTALNAIGVSDTSTASVAITPSEPALVSVPVSVPASTPIVVISQAVVSTPVPMIMPTLTSLTFVENAAKNGGKLVWVGTNIESVLYTGSADAYPSPFNYGAFTLSWDGSLVNMVAGVTYTMKLEVRSSSGGSDSKTIEYTIAKPVVDTSAADAALKAAAEKKAADEAAAAALKIAQEKAAAEAKAAEDAAAALKVAQEKATADAKAAEEAAALKVAQDKAAADAKAAAALKVAQEKATADAKAAAEAKAAEEAAVLKIAQDKAAADAAALALTKKTPILNLFTSYATAKYTASQTAKMKKLTLKLEPATTLKCVGYIYTKGTTAAKAKAIALAQAKTTCANAKKLNPSITTVVTTAALTKAPKPLVGASNAKAKYRVDLFAYKG